MKKYLLLLSLLVCSCALGYSYPWMGFVFSAAGGLALLALGVGFLCRLIWKGLPISWVRTPLRVLAVSAIATAANVLRPLEPAILHSPEAGKALAYAYRTDQADRLALRPYLPFLTDNMRQRDRLRLAQARRLYEEKKLVSPTHRFHAAFLFHHGKSRAHYKVAHELAASAAAAPALKDEYVVQWLAKASYDRWMVSLGHPQKYGTQGKFSLQVE